MKNTLKNLMFKKYFQMLTFNSYSIHLFGVLYKYREASYERSS